jgi:molybdopterin converting factor small subunit
MSEILVKIPAALRAFANGAYELRAPAGTVADVLAQLRLSHPQLVHHVQTADGDLRPFVNVFIDRANVRSMQGLATPVPAGAVLSILPAVAGG